jgi:hypothetical protein
VSLAELIGFGISCTVGSGIYALIGVGAQDAGTSAAFAVRGDASRPACCVLLLAAAE